MPRGRRRTCSAGICPVGKRYSGRLDCSRRDAAIFSDDGPQPQGYGRDEIRVGSANQTVRPDMMKNLCEAVLDRFQVRHRSHCVATSYLGRKLDEGLAHQLGGKLLDSKFMADFGPQNSGPRSASTVFEAGFAKSTITSFGGGLQRSTPHALADTDPIISRDLAMNLTGFQRTKATPSLRPSRQIILQRRSMKSEAATRWKLVGKTILLSTSTMAPKSLRFQIRQSTSSEPSPTKMEPVLKPFLRSCFRRSSGTEHLSLRSKSDVATRALMHRVFPGGAIDIAGVT